MDQQD